MPKTAQPTELEVDRDEAFQRREWRVQRVGWVAIAVLIALALLGVFGGGPLAHASATSAGVPLRLDYDRFLRYGSPDELRLLLDPAAIRGDGVAHLWIPHRYLDHIEVTRVTPEPERVLGGSAGVLYEFQLTPGQPAIVSIMVKPEHAGPLDGQIVLPDRRGLTFRQFVYP